MWRKLLIGFFVDSILFLGSSFTGYDFRPTIFAFSFSWWFSPIIKFYTVNYKNILTFSLQFIVHGKSCLNWASAINKYYKLHVACSIFYVGINNLLIFLRIIKMGYFNCYVMNAMAHYNELQYYGNVFRYCTSLFIRHQNISFSKFSSSFFSKNSQP